MSEQTQRLVELVLDEDSEANGKQDVSHRDNRPRHRNNVRKKRQMRCPVEDDVFGIERQAFHGSAGKFECFGQDRHPIV